MKLFEEGLLSIKQPFYVLCSLMVLILYVMLDTHWVDSLKSSDRGLCCLWSSLSLEKLPAKVQLTGGFGKDLQVQFKVELSDLFRGIL